MDLHTSVIHLLCLAVGPVFTWIYTPLSSHPPTAPCLAAWFTWIYASLFGSSLPIYPPVGSMFTWIYTPLSSHPPTVPCLAAWFTWIYASLLRIQLADLPTSRVHFHMDLHTSIISSPVPCLAFQRGSHGSTHPYFVSSLPIDLHQYFDLHSATLASTVRCLVVPEVWLPCALHLTVLKCNCFVLSTPIAISHHR